MTVLAAHEIVRYLEGRGVTKVFGLCGHTVIAMLEALSGSERIEFVNVRHEQIASHAADGYARVTRRHRGGQRRPGFHTCGRDRR